MDDESAVAPWSSSRPAIEFNRGWQHEAAVIVGVLADQIHAAGCPVNACGGAEACLECVQKLVGRFQRAALSLICLIFGCAFVRRDRGHGGWELKLVAVLCCCAMLHKAFFGQNMSLRAFLSRRVV